MAKKIINDGNFEAEIIIITYNNLEDTKRCLESIKLNTDKTPYRLIFVDNGSNDGTIDFLKKVPNSILIENSENRGFVKAMNQGFDQVTAKYTVWLNNDVIVTSNWLEILINHLEKNPKAAAIGPLTNGTGIIQKCDEFKIDKPNIDEISKFGISFYKKHKDDAINFHRVAGFCIVMKSNLIKEIGKLDEQFNLGGYDDDDYCRRIKKAGHDIIIAKDVFIYHKSGVTYSSIKDPDKQLSFVMSKGRREFLRKWCRSLKKADISEKPLISIIMPTKDRPNLIINAIRSVINQSYSNWELIIINDGGEDISKLVSSFNDSKINYVNLDKNFGKSHANNVGIERSKGGVIAYLDDDDVWYPNHLEVCIRELMRFENRKFVYSDFIKSQYLIENSIQVPIKKEVMLLQQQNFKTLKYGNWVANFCMVHKKELFDFCGKYDEKLDYYEDWDVIRRFAQSTILVHVPEITGEYKINPSTIARNELALSDPNLEKVKNSIKSKLIVKNDQIHELLDEVKKQSKKRRYKTSIKILKKILDKDSECFPALEQLCSLLLDTKIEKSNEQYFILLQKLNPDYPYSYILYARFLIKMKNFEEAKKQLELALIIADIREAYEYLKECYQRLGHNKTADHLKKVMLDTVSTLNLSEIEEVVITIYNNSSLFRKLLSWNFKFLKKWAQKYSQE